MRLDWRPVNGQGTIWITLCERFVVVANSAKLEARKIYGEPEVIRDEDEAPMREAATWAQVQADKDDAKA
jgi:hypothetical protein